MHQLGLNALAKKQFRGWAGSVARNGFLAPRVVARAQGAAEKGQVGCGKNARRGWHVLSPIYNLRAFARGESGCICKSHKQNQACDLRVHSNSLVPVAAPQQ